MLDGAVVIPLQSLFWTLLFEVAALLWMVDRALLSVGYFILTLTGWMSQNVFAPLLSVVSDQTGVLVGPIFLIALTVLGFTYLMAVFGRFQVVNFRSAVLWLLFAAALYTFGPSLYTGMEDFRRFVGGGFYQLGVDAFNDASSATGLNAIGTLPSDSVPIPTDQFGQFLPGVPGATAVDGLDVAMAYIGADGYDVLAASGSPHPIARLPWEMVEDGADGLFDPDTGPNAFSGMTDAERQASIGRALQGLWRAFTTLFIAIFGIIEQLVNFLMACSFAIAFFGMFIAVLFGFFVRTEMIAWSALNLIIELFVQSIINSLLMSLVLGFVMVGANTGNAILLLGASLVGLWMSWNLLQGCIKGLMNSTERLYKSFATSTGGNFATVSETNKTMTEGTVSAATGISVIAGGGSFLQSLGSTFGDARTAQTMNYAARMLGGEETLLGSAAQSIGEGASARSLAGPLGGYLLGNQSKAEAHEERTAEKRRRYVGENDEARDVSLSRYLRTGNEAELEQSFAEKDVPRVQALADTYEPEDFAMIVRAVRHVRNDNPGISPQSPTFMGKLRQELSSPLREMEAPALEDFATVFGASADPSPYLESRSIYTPPVLPMPQLGSADFERDEAVEAYRQAKNTGQTLPNLQDAFSPEDANRVARLMDAYDDDDFAQVVYAVRAAREAYPDAPVGSSQVLQTSRKNLPDALQNMPSRDLAAFSRAFGASASQPAISDETPKAHIGTADHDRDLLVDLYRDGNEDARILKQGFSYQSAKDVAILANEYSRDDFDAVVRAVRQARTTDPDLEVGSPATLRATRKLLPEHLRQMPSSDLTAFSTAFGGAADTASIPPRTRYKQPRHRRYPRRRSFAQLQAADDALYEGTWSMDLDENESEEFPKVEQNNLLTQSVPDTLSEQAGLVRGTAMQPMRGLGTARIQRLAKHGISTLEALRDAQPTVIAAALRVGEAQVLAWQQQARVLLTTGTVAATTGAGLMTAVQAATNQSQLQNPDAVSIPLPTKTEQPNSSPAAKQRRTQMQPQSQQVSSPVSFKPAIPTSVNQQGLSANEPAPTPQIQPIVESNKQKSTTAVITPVNSATVSQRPLQTNAPVEGSHTTWNRSAQTSKQQSEISQSGQIPQPQPVVPSNNSLTSVTPTQAPYNPVVSAPQQRIQSSEPLQRNNTTAISPNSNMPIQPNTSQQTKTQTHTPSVSNPPENFNPNRVPNNPTAFVPSQKPPRSDVSPTPHHTANSVSISRQATETSTPTAQTVEPKQVQSKQPSGQRIVSQPKRDPASDVLPSSFSIPLVPASTGQSSRLNSYQNTPENPKPPSEEDTEGNSAATDEESSE